LTLGAHSKPTNGQWARSYERRNLNLRPLRNAQGFG
jgi:hypothetical protein